MNANFTGIHSTDQLKDIWESDSATAINQFLHLHEDSETPRVYLTWSLLAFAAGLLGRNAIFSAGPTHVVKPNLFVVLLGPSRTRKSTAINMTKSLLESSTLNFAPTDTGGQRHGIMSAMSGLNRLVGPKNHYPDLGPLTSAMIHPRRSDDMMIVSPEFGQLMGSGSVDMANFLNGLYDGEIVDYQTKAGETRLNAPLATLLAATTPQNLAGILPESATGHGIIGRMVFVYADKIHKSVPLPNEVKEEWYEDREKIVDRLRWIDDNRVNFGLSSRAREKYSNLYGYIPEVADPRLETYRDGRNTILIKVSMCVAALRGDNTVIESDMGLAHELLHMIEPNMHKALEFFGRNKAYAGRMAILQFLRQQPGKQAGKPAVLAAAASELTPMQAEEAIQGMLASGDIIQMGDKIILAEAKNDLLAARNRDKLRR